MGIAVFLMAFSGFGITGGAHRLWAHRSYKAKVPLRLLVAVGQTMALQVLPIKMLFIINNKQYYNDGSILTARYL